MLAKLNKQVADRAKPQAKPYEITDTELRGFLLRVQPSGRRFWKVRRKDVNGGKPITLGQHPAMTAAMARATAERYVRGEIRIERKAEGTFAGFLDRYYLPWAEQHHKGAAKNAYRLRSLPFQDHRLDSITLAEVDAWRANRLAEGKTSTTINRDVASLKAALQKAVDWEVITNNPLDRLKPVKVDNRAVVRYLSPEEETRLREALAVSDLFLRAFVTVALNTGLRRSEIFALRWCDVDVKARRLTLRGGDAKSGQTRHIPLNQIAIDALKEWRGAASPIPELPVFQQREFKRSWATLLRRAEITGFRFHDSRHHFASKLVMAGVDLNTVRELLGHADLKMTLRYAHLAPDHLAAAVDVLCDG